MKYYLVNKEVVEQLQLTKIRAHCADGRYVLNTSDLVPIGVEEIVDNGKAKELTLPEAKKILKENKI
jgi:hypothetical protein